MLSRKRESSPVRQTGPQVATEAVSSRGEQSGEQIRSVPGTGALQGGLKDTVLVGVATRNKINR